MKPCSPLRFTLSALALMLWTTGSAFAQEEPAADAIFIDRVDVNVVNVEVFVTDNKGRRVAGLTADDFAITEDGQPVEISNFYAVTREDRLAADLGKDTSALLDQPPTAQRPPLPEDQQLNLVVYVDHFNIRPENRNRVLESLEGFLEDRITQGDNVMLIGYDRGLDVVAPFTREPSQIIEGLRKMSKLSTSRQLDDAERRRVMRYMLTRVSSGGPPLGGNGGLATQGTAEDDLRNAYQYVRSYVQATRSDLRQAAGAIRSVVRSLAGLPGRKAMLYVSDGLPQRPGEDLYQLLANMFSATELRGLRNGSVDPVMETQREDESHLFKAITEEANAHQVTLYTLDARGPRGSSSLSAEFADLSAGNGGSVAIEAQRTTSLQEPLIALAGETGGTPILNASNFGEALAIIGSDFDSFYSLGYRSPRGGDSKFHRIDVKVKRPGLKVRHRNGYVDKPEEERVADRTLSSLILDLEKNPLGVELDFGVPEEKSRGRFLLPILIRIPFRELTLLPNGEVEEGRLRIFLAVQDEEGGISDLHDFPYPISVPRDQMQLAREREIGYQTTLNIRGGTPKVAIAVWDELSGTESYVHKRVLVGKDKEKKDKKDRRETRGR